MPADSEASSPTVTAEASPSRPAFPRRRIAGALLFLLFALTFLASLHVYLAMRLLSSPALSAAQRGFGVLALIGLFLSMPAGIFLGRLGPKWIASPARWVAFLWMGTFGILVTLTAATDLLRVVGLASGLLSPVGAAWQSVVVITLAVPAVAYAIRVARGPAKVERVRVALPHLGPGLEGLRIAQISDIHIGDTLDGRFLQRLVDDVNALKPDLIAVTGDLVDGSVAELRDHVRPLGSLRAPMGVYFVTGNHEYYSGVDAWIAEVRRLGLTVLHNEHVVLTRVGDRFVLAGVTDYSGGQFDPLHASRPDVALAGAPADVPRVLLAHQPRSARAAAAAGVHLQLSGHTHGGQIFPFNFFVRLQQPAVAGLTTLHGVQVYTHRGSGYWGPPMRLGAPPEIAEVTLARRP